MAFDFKNEFKEFYMPKNKPEIVTVPKANYIAVRGKGNPNEEGGEYKQAVGILYAIAYTLKMSPQRLRLWINIWKTMDTAMTLAMADFTMKYICPMQERLLLRSGRL